MHSSDGLYLIGLILAALEKIQIHKKEIPSRIIKWISHAKTVGQHEVSLRVNFTNMARFLILSGSNDYKGEKLTVDHPSFIDASTMAADFNNGQVRGKLQDLTIPAPFLEEDKKVGLGPDKAVSTLDSETLAKLSNIANSMKESGIELEEVSGKAEKPRSFLEAAQAGKYGNIGSKGGAHEL